MDKQYIKLKDLDGSTIEVEAVEGYKFKRWNPTERKMEVSDRWVEGFRKTWRVVTDKGILDISSNQMGKMLEAVQKDGQSDLIGKTLQIKAFTKGEFNDYFFNHVQEWQQQASAQSDEPARKEHLDEDDDVDLSEIPF